jgi:NTE family protein
MGKTALILGGGGALGISWETGLLAGLQRAGVDVTNADLIVGTSAGSIVGTQVAQGYELSYLLEEHQTGDIGTKTPMDFDPANLMAVFQKWAAYPEMNAERCAEIGSLAIASKTASEDAWLAPFEEFIQPDWPDRDLRICAVDAESGQFVAWARDSAVEIRRAVASSCAVPGMLPVVHIGGHVYQDGGVRSGTNADLAAGYENVLVVAPIGVRGDGIDPLLGRITRREAEELRKQGTNVELVFPSQKTTDIMGINRMDSTKRSVTADAGVEQGLELAKRLEPSWSKTPA